jgi:hypothetical protein
MPYYYYYYYYYYYRTAAKHALLTAFVYSKGEKIYNTRQSACSLPEVFLK